MAKTNRGKTSMGEIVVQRELDRVPGASNVYAPGQESVKILDPYPRRDQADMAAILSFVDGDHVLWSVTCMRYRDDGWRAVIADRYSAVDRVGEGSSVVDAVELGLSPEHLALLEAGCADREPYPFEEPSEDEQEMRRFAHALVDMVMRDDA